MRRVSLACGVLAVFSVSFLAMGQEKRPREVSGEVFFTEKARPLALERIYPGITAALQLTDEQKVTLRQAVERTVRGERVRAAATAVKGNPAATQAQRDEVQKLVEAARRELADVVAKTLTAEQKALVAKIQAAYEESQKAARQVLEEEFNAAKEDADKAARLNERMREDTRAELTARLGGILTKEQQAAVDVAGMAQRDREEEEAARKKK